jgi:hypothetical protein
LKDAGLEAGDIDEVVLVGGQTRMPKVQQVVKEFFGKEPHKGGTEASGSTVCGWLACPPGEPCVASEPGRGEIPQETTRMEGVHA